MVRRAVQIFNELGAQHLIHCGDIGGTGVFDELLHCPLTFVWGNCDFYDSGLLAYLKSVKIAEPAERPPTVVTLAGKRIAVFHGHEQGFHRAPESLDVQYIMHGHTHVARDESANGTRIINPGALHRARVKSVASLDLAEDKLTFHEVDSR